MVKCALLPGDTPWSSTWDIYRRPTMKDSAQRSLTSALPKREMSSHALPSHETLPSPDSEEIDLGNTQGESRYALYTLPRPVSVANYAWVTVETMSPPSPPTPHHILSCRRRMLEIRTRCGLQKPTRTTHITGHDYDGGTSQWWLA